MKYYHISITNDVVSQFFDLFHSTTRFTPCLDRDNFSNTLGKMKSLLVLMLALLSTTRSNCQLSSLDANYTSPSGVGIYNPSLSFKPTGPWSLMSSAGGTLYVAGMRGVHSRNDSLVPIGEPRIRQAFQNMADLVAYAGGDLTSCLRLVVFVSDMYRWRPIVNSVTQEFWPDAASYCSRTIVEIQRVNDDDICEVEGTFWVGQQDA